MTPLESRNSEPVNRVRCFGRTALDKTIVESKCKWDLVKIICSQPFNKRVQYGLSFVTLHSSDAKDSVATSVDEVSAVPQKLFGNFKIREDSPDSESESPQSLFARWKGSRNGGDNKEPSSSLMPLSGSFCCLYVVLLTLLTSLYSNSCSGHTKSFRNDHTEKSFATNQSNSRHTETSGESIEH